MYTRVTITQQLKQFQLVRLFSRNLTGISIVKSILNKSAQICTK